MKMEHGIITNSDNLKEGIQTKFKQIKKNTTIKILMLIPFFKTIVDYIMLLSDAYCSINDFFYYNNLNNFFKGICEGTIDKYKIDDYLKKFKDNSESVNIDAKYFLELIRNVHDSQKAVRLGYLFTSFINGMIKDSNLFYELAEINNQILETDFKILLDFDIYEIRNSDCRINRLVSLGLIEKEYSVSDYIKEQCRLSELGKIYCNAMRPHYPEKKYHKIIDDFDIESLF